jgi:hypothetical protein
VIAMPADLLPLWKLLLLGAGVLAVGLGTPALPPVADLPPVDQLRLIPELPDPLQLFDGRRVASREQWEQERRPELKRLFQHYMYGYLPSSPDRVTATVEREDRQYFGGKATKREVLLRFGPDGTPPIRLLLVVPNARKGPAPVFLGIAFVANYAVVNDPTIPVPDGWQYPNRPGVVNNRATEAGRGSAVDTWNVERSIDRGFAVATFYNGDVDPDRPDFNDGIHPFFLRPGQTAPGPYDWGTIGAWAWGMQRAVDYLVTDRDVDPKRIAAVGHSRNGKTALLAAAFDERIALAIPLQAGCGGTAPSRGKVGESVARINTSFPHWFNDQFPKFNDQPERLPFDQHCLVALCAPRPVLFANATEDTWANPEGQFEVLRAADPVYRFLGVEGLAAASMPPPGKLVASRLGYFIRPGQHSMTTEDWNVFLDYADRYLKPPTASR